jgi:thiol-disulfide isomerase/thioredoxin
MPTVRLCVLAGVLGAGLLAACGDTATPADAALEAKFKGKNISSLSVATLDGTAQALNDPLLLNGKPVIINVWATWCAPCLKEMPTLDALGKTGQYTVLAIATDADAQTVKDYLRRQPWGSGLTVLHDRLGATTRRELGAVALPITYVTDPSLTIKKIAVGERDWHHPRMQQQIERALGR